MFHIDVKDISTDILVLDEQHAKIINIMEDLKASVSNYHYENVETLLNSLHEVSQAHFKDEEAYMLSIGYPELEEHIIEHRKLEEKAKKLREDFKAGQPVLMSIIAFLSRDWLRQHVKESDMKYVGFQKQGAK